MIRLLFPKISFSGRLDRAGFWREIAVSAFTTPLAVGVISYLLHEVATAASSGLAVDNARMKAIVGVLLANLAVRNMLVFAGVVRRRLNDLGLEGAKIFTPAVPLLLFFGISFVVTLVSQAPAGAEKQLAVGLLTFALVAVLLWQFLRAINVGFQVMFGPSGALAGGRAAPSFREAMAKSMPRDIQDAVTGFRGRFDTAMRDFQGSAGGKPQGFEAIDKLFAPAIDALNEWAKPQPADAGDASARGLRQSGRAGSKDARRATPVRGGREAGRANNAPAQAVRGAGKAVVVARHEPRAGRSKWYSGILTGPWG